MKRSSWAILLVKQGFEQYVYNQIVSKQTELFVDDVFVSNDLTGYIFIRSIEMSSQSICQLLTLEGSLKFLGEKNGSIKKFTNGQINNLNMQITSLSTHQSNKTLTSFKLGDKVVIKHGDLSDIEGVIVEISKRVVKIKPSIFPKIIKARVKDISFI